MKKYKELEEHIFKSLSKASYKEPLKPYKFSGSAFPICPRIVALSDTPPFAFVSRPRSEAILGNGTLNHAIIQKWLGNDGILFGKFKNNKGIITPAPQYEQIPFEKEKKLIDKGKLPPKYDSDKYNWIGTKGPLYNSDGTPMDYVEWRVYDKDCGFTGLVDAIIKMPDWDKYVVCDFKFVGDYSFNKYKHEGIEDDAPYRYQLNSYRYCLEGKVLNTHGKQIPLADFMYLIVFKEDFLRNMKEESIQVIPIKFNPDLYLEQKELYLKVQKKLKKRDLKYFTSHKSAICEVEADCGYCNGKYICFAPNSKENISKLLKTKWGIK